MTAFDPVDSRADFPALERDVRSFWEAERIFQRSVEERPADNTWVFYEGPPTANGVPHMGHVVQRTLKDLFPRYHTMRGQRVVRKGGWDTHGLPVEIEVEKELGLTNKQQVEEYGVAAYNQKCRESVFRYIDQWTEFTRRLGLWLDLDNPYITYQAPYMESVWAILKQVFDRGLLYKGYRVVPYCPRCATPLSSHELSLGYQDDIKDPSVFILFELVDEPGTFVMAWTTTPWTLPGNVALAVGPGVDYVKVQHGDRRIILAAERLDVLDGPYEVLEHLTSEQLKERRYQPLYTYLVPEGARAFVILEADFVDVAEGTGVVHTSAAYGEDDLRLCQANGVLVRHTVDLRGRFMPEVEPFAGMFVKDADVPIMNDLNTRGLLYKKGTIRHTYPFCWRCGTALLYYAMDSWFIRMSDLREEMLAVNRGTNWYPGHVRDGRMGNWLETLQDWSLSRLRYWGTPLPIWECEACDERRCVGSVAELGLTLEADLHRPFIDEVTLECAQCGGTMRRVVDLIDVWFDSGSMPFAQYHYPFDEADWKHQFPADFIAEGLDQTRGWFYSLMAIGVLVTGRNSYRNVMVNGTVLDAEGKKMSKSTGNGVEPIPMFDRFGADAVRWYFVTAASIGNDYRFSEKAVEETLRRFQLILWNTYSFFVTYANLDGFTAAGTNQAPAAERPLLDRWLLSQLNLTVERVTRELDAFDHTAAGRAIEELVTDLSTWYVRRSRRRFWKAESDSDKLSAYQALHQALLTITRLLAPFTPFLAEAMYRNLSRGVEGTADSVHLALWPEVDPAATDRALSTEMARARRIVEMGHRERDRAQLKVRQPLRGATVPGPALGPELESIVLDELNLKALSYADADAREVVLDTEITHELRLEGLGRELVRRVQETRKQAEFSIDDRIELYWRAEGELAEAMEAWGEHVGRETLALKVEHLHHGDPREAGLFAREVAIDGQPLWLGLKLSSSPRLGGG